MSGDFNSSVAPSSTRNRRATTWPVLTSGFATSPPSRSAVNPYCIPVASLKEDEYYFTKKKAKCDDSSSREATRLDRKRTDRRTHFLHALSKAIVEECVERGVGAIVVGDLGGIREDDERRPELGDSRNLDLHGWTFDRFTTLLDYKAEAEGIDVKLVSERDTSKSCSVVDVDGNQRVERGLYVARMRDG